jgi:large subunit ribosomal protein L22
MTRASLKNYRQSSRKVRLLADLVRGKKVSSALILLKNTPKHAASPIRRLVESAIANAKQKNLSVENLIVKKITVDQGPTFFRRRLRARGAAYVVRKRTSHINVELEEIKPAFVASKKK